MNKPISAHLPSLARTGAALSRFLRWWADELAGWLPVRLRLWWRETGRIVLVAVDEGKRRAVFLRPAKDRLEEIHVIEFEHGNPAVAGAQLAQTLRRTMGGPFQLMLCLPPAQVLQRSLSLPLAVEENLRQTLNFELDRYTPFRPDQVHFDFRIGTRHPEKGQMTVELAVMPRAQLDKAMQQTSAIGLPIAGAVLAEDVLYRGSECRNLLPAGIRQARRSSIRPIWRLGLVMLSALLLAAVLAVPLWQKRATAISLLAPLDEARQAAQEVDGRRNMLGKLVEEHNFLPDKKWGGLSVLRVLDELSKRLPDDTFVMQFDFDGKSIQIQGESASSSSLVELLEASPLFKDVGFKAQLTKIQGTASDRFHIAANLKVTEKDQPAPPKADGAASPPPAPEEAAAKTGSAKP